MKIKKTKNTNYYTVCDNGKNGEGARERTQNAVES